MEIRSASNLGPRVQLVFTGKGRTKQAPAAECDINEIMAKYVKTGLLAHANSYRGEYGFASAVDFHGAMNIVTKADQMFDALPAKVRDRFSNDPASFLDFVQADDNEAEMIELGLADPIPVIPVIPPERPPEPPEPARADEVVAPPGGAGTVPT